MPIARHEDEQGALAQLLSKHTPEAIRLRSEALLAASRHLAAKARHAKSRA